MTNVNSRFHEVCMDGVSRIRIYSIPDAVDCTDDADVVANGTLMTLNNADTDSNGRISQNGVTLTDIYNKDEELNIGLAASSQFRADLMNQDGGLNGYDYCKFKVFIDAYDATNEAWVIGPFGVYYWNKPSKRTSQIVSATANDQMILFDSIADSWWASLDFSNGLTLYDIVSDMATTLGVHLHPDTASTMINGSYSFATVPFTATEITYREILEYIAAASACNVKFDRNGYLRFFPFQAAEISGVQYSINADALQTPVFAYDVAEYQCEAISKLVVQASENDFGVVVGSGTNALNIIDDPFLYGESDADIRGRATNIYNVVSAYGGFTPISLNANIDWSIESGDIIKLTLNSTDYQIPIFQQTMTWLGGLVRSELFSSGYAERPIESKQNRSEIRSKKALHDLVVTAEELLSRIQTLDGSYSTLQQAVDSIGATVSGLDSSVSSLIDANGILFEFKETASDAIASNAEGISEIQSHIYFGMENGKPYILLQADTEDSQVSQKIYNDALDILVGAVVNTHIDSTGINTDNVTATNSVQIGDWLWHKTDSGHLVLDLI